MNISCLWMVLRFFELGTIVFTSQLKSKYMQRQFASGAHNYFARAFLARYVAIAWREALGRSERVRYQTCCSLAEVFYYATFGLHIHWFGMVFNSKY